MPSENDKILKAYDKTQPVNEATTGSAAAGIAGGAATGAAMGSILPGVGTVAGGVIGGALGAAGNIGAGAHNRASVSMQKFLTGRGGGISQAVGSVLGTIGGKYFDRLKAQHGAQDTANWLFSEIQGLLSRHDGILTIKQIKDFLKTKDVKKGGGKIDPQMLPSIASLPDQQSLNEEQIITLFQSLAPEIHDVADTGVEAEANVEEIIRAVMNLPAADRGVFIAAYIRRGLI